MKAAVLSDVNQLTIVERPRPKIGPNEALIKVACTAICGSDIHAFRTALFYPVGTIMGHEIAGIVAELGEKVIGFSVGDRVAVRPLAPCRVCDACVRGRDNQCHRFLECHGGYAEYVRIPWPQDMLYTLSDDVSFEAATLADPLASSLHGIRQSKFNTGDRVVVIGAGPIGLGVIQLLEMNGVEDLIALEVSPQRSKIALQLGTSIVLDPTDDPIGIIEKIFQLTGELVADIVFECAGVPQALQQSIHYVRKGGQVMVVGITEHDTPINPMAFVLAEVEMKGCLGYTTHEFQTVIRMVTL